MKKALALVGALLLLLGVITGVQATEKKSKLALDLVIVIDESGSMSAESNITKNDYNGYRHDAAASLLSLCDAKQSRVALIPFSDPEKVTYLNEIALVNELHHVTIDNNNRKRSELISLLINDNNKTGKCETLYEFSQQYGGQTDIGTALDQAVELLVNDKSGNTPVIVLLTDGDFCINKPGTSDVDTNAVQLSKDKYVAAYNKAADNDIKVFTVALAKNETGLASLKDRHFLEDAARATNAIYQGITSASDLPEVFNSFFAHLVGSEVVSLKGVTSYDAQAGEYTATFTVPNQSIAEANILIPVGKSQYAALYKPGSNETVAYDNNKYLKFSTSYFTLLKILNPREVGEWRVVYSNPSKKELEDITVNVIFSYDVVPEISFSNNPLPKTAETKVMVKFKNPDGKYTTDTSLYNGDIQAYLKVYDSNDAPILELDKPMNKEADCFSYSLKMSDLKENILSGDYKFCVSLKGAGMDDYTETVVQLKNEKPQLTNAGKEAALNFNTLHDPRRDDYQSEQEKTLDLNTYITEPDGEAISFEWLGIDTVVDGNPLIKMESLENGMLQLVTNNVSGKGTAKISVKDIENAETIINIPVYTLNKKQQFADECSLHVTHDMNEESVEKKKQVTFTAQLFQGEETVHDQPLLDLVNLNGLQLEQVFEKDGANAKPVRTALTFVQEGNVAKAKADISVHAASYSVVGEPLLRDIPLKMEVDSFSTKNQKPELTGEGDNPFADKKIHDPLTSEYGTEASCTINLNDFVRDPDGEKLAFELVASGNTEIVTKSLNASTGELTLKTTGISGEEEISLVAKDPENATVSLKIPVKITNVATEIRENFALSVTLPETADKDSDVSVIVELHENGKKCSKSAELLQLVDFSGLQLNIAMADGNSSAEEIAFTPQGDHLTATFKTGGTSALYTVVGTVSMKDGTIPLNLNSNNCAVGNTPPVLNTEYVEGLQHEFSIDPFLWATKSEKEYPIDLAEMFKDSSKDKLVFRVGLLPEATDEIPVPGERTAREWAVDPAVEELSVEENGAYVVLNEKSGKRVFVLSATDGDEQIEAYLFEEKIISQKEEIIKLLIFIAICIAVICLLFLCWYRFIYRKKWTAKHGRVILRVNNVPLGTAAGFPKSGRADVFLSSLHIADAGNGELRKELVRLGSMYKLRAGKRETVIIRRVKKGQSSFTLFMGTRTMSGGTKKMLWQPNTTLQLKADRKFENIIIELKREPGETAARNGIVNGRRNAPSAPSAASKRSSKPTF